MFAGTRGWDVKAFLTQIFHVGGSYSDFSGVVLRSETFLLRLRCDLVQSLDMAIGNEMFNLVPDMCYMMGGTLIQLTLRFRECDISMFVDAYRGALFTADQILTGPGYSSHARIHGLRCLENLTIWVAPRLWHFAAMTVDTWVSASKALPTSQFKAEFQYDSEESCSIEMVTVMQVRRIVHGSTLLDMAPLGGTMHFDLLAREGVMVATSDIKYADEMLDDLRQDVFSVASIHPCRCIYVPI